ADGHVAEFHERAAADANDPRLGVEPLAVALGAAHHPHVLFELGAPRAGSGLLELGDQLRNDALPLAAVLPHAAAALLPLLEDVLAPPAHALERANKRNGTVVEAQRRIGNQEIAVEGVERAETVARRAHPVRTVEAEELRCRRLVANVAVGAGVVGGEKDV